MARFTFRLEQVLVYRRRLEEQAMQDLAEATARRDATLERIRRLEAEVADQRARLCQAVDLAPEERWLIQCYERALKTDLSESRLTLAQQEEDVDACRSALIQKSQERELLEKLKEKQAQKHALQERLIEQREYDETATLRYRPVAL